MKDRKRNNDQQKQAENDDPVYNFWQDHSERFLEMALRVDYRERIAYPDAHGKRTGDCGDTVEFFLMIEHNRIKTITFDVHGCINTNACANAVVELTRGKSLNKTWKMKPEDIAFFLESLPPDHRHCAELAAGAFYLALANYREIKKNPWKKMYFAR